MNEAAIIEWLPELRPTALALVIGFIPALIVRRKRRPMTLWYLYGFLCALFAWPAVALPTIHALLVHGKPEPNSEQRRRASALALLKEESVRSYPSWIAELRPKSATGIAMRRYAYEHLGPGESLEIVRERVEPQHRAQHRHGEGALVVPSARRKRAGLIVRLPRRSRGCEPRRKLPRASCASGCREQRGIDHQ
jgi:hypothetical protein